MTLKLLLSTFRHEGIPPGRETFAVRDERASECGCLQQTGRKPASFLVTMSEGPYPIPSRTRKSSPPEPMVLRARVRGRVGRCQVYLQSPEASDCFGAFLFPSRAFSWLSACSLCAGQLKRRSDARGAAVRPAGKTRAQPQAGVLGCGR